MKLLLAVLLLADAWSAAVAARADRDSAVKALGKPQKEFIASLEKGAFPLQLFDAVSESEKPRRAVRVLQWKGGAKGLAYQLVLEDGKALYAIAPPLDDEKDVAAVRAKHGAAEPRRETVVAGDVFRAWEVLDYPDKKLLFVKKPGEDAIVARLLLP